MPRSLIMLLVLVAALVRPSFVHATEATDWEKTIGNVWKGEALIREQVDGRTCPELRYLRNIPYARHGYALTRPWIVQQFGSDTRYIPNKDVTDNTVERLMTANDRANIDVVVATQEAMGCATWWRENGDSVKDLIVVPRQLVVIEETQMSPTEKVVEPKTVYFQIQQMNIDASGITYTPMDEATPNLIIDRALGGKMVENEWLAPLTCGELGRVEDALYARYKVDFKDLRGDFFVTAGAYQPIPGLTRQIAEAHLFQSVDELTLLRVDRAQGNRNCRHPAR